MKTKRKKPMKHKPIHQLKAKGNNKRIVIQIIEYEDKTHAVAVHTKKLQDFKKRHIIRTDNLYSIETFALLKDMFSFILDKPEIKNKLLLKELDEINYFKVSTTI